MSKLSSLLVAGLVIFAALQVVRPGIPVKFATAELQAPPEIRHIFDKNCYACHSDQLRLSWFDHIVAGAARYPDRASAPELLDTRHPTRRHAEGNAL
jgi:heme-binding protein